MSKEIYIYALVDPRDNKIRYIGKTTQTLHNRLMQHLRDRGAGKNNYRRGWINQLKELELKPSIKILEITNKNWQTKEKFWISKFKKTLTNLTEGGDGANYYSVTREAIEKHIATNKTKRDIKYSKLINYNLDKNKNVSKLGTKRGSSKSTYYGVSWNSKSNSWRVGLQYNNLRMTFGFRKDELEAAKLYNEEAPKYLKEKFKPNKI